jgi:hypothetical protein
VRNPLDVATCRAHQSKATIDAAISDMAKSGFRAPATDPHLYDVIGSWSQHVGLDRADQQASSYSALRGHHPNGARGLEVLLVHPGGPFGVKRMMAPDPFRRAKSMPLMLQSRWRGASLPRSSARALQLVHSGRWGRSDSAEASALSHSPARDIFDPAALISNTFDMEWLPGTGRRQSFPEVDRAEWLEIDFARTKILSAQVELSRSSFAIAAESNIE